MLIKTRAQSVIFCGSLELVIKVEKIKINQRAGFRVLGNVAAQKLNGLLILTNRNEKIGLLLDIKQFLRIHGSGRLQQARSKAKPVFGIKRH